MASRPPSDGKAVLRSLPPIDRLLDHAAWASAPHVAPDLRREACRRIVDECRKAILAGEEPELDLDDLVARALTTALETVRPILRPVVNATGVVLHTNLGRAPLSAAALDAIQQSGGRYLNLEMDLDAGRRDNRMDRLSGAFSRILDCGDVVVANNNAAAVFLTLSCLAGQGQGVAVSRGELVEIGGSFRMPDIMAASGARMVEVGTTNRTHLADYETAFADGTTLAIKVHRSNFSVVGFTSEVSIEDLARSAKEHGVLVIHDLGSGLLRSAEHLGQDCVRRSLDSGADLVLFSGDKLLGGPQCGLIAGRPEIIERIRKHPVLRLVRPGKLTMLALEATLLAWERDPEGGEIPCARLAARAQEDLRSAAEALAGRIEGLVGDKAAVEVEAVESTTGGGSSEHIRLPSFAVSLRPATGMGSEAGLAASLRQGDPAVITRVEEGRVFLDLRTLLPGDDEAIAAALQRWLAQGAADQAQSQKS
ncbi:MAG: L-seryl-tRNA(Sec) selenium transferase [Myxococcota bacterium]|nr:L-seryl-tRNA(Sec) selenium transferase [Myxococcota bacterium]